MGEEWYGEEEECGKFCLRCRCSSRLVAVALFAVGMGGAAAGAASAAVIVPQEVDQAQANACEGGIKVDGAGVYDLVFLRAAVSSSRCT